MSDRRESDEALKAEWLAQNEPKRGATLTAMGAGGITDDLMALISKVGIVGFNGGGDAVWRYEQARIQTIKIVKSESRAGGRPRRFSGI